MPTRIRAFAILIPVALMAAGGCTQVDRAAAIKLADAGKSAAAAAATEAATARNEFAANGERSAALELMGRVAADSNREARNFEPPEISEALQRQNIAVVLKKREEALTLLSATYAEMGALAAADPGADVRKASGEMFDSVNGLLAVINAIPAPGVAFIAPISKTVGAVFAEGVSLYAEERQRREILAAAAAIAEALPKLRAVIEWERIYAKVIREETVRIRENLATALINQGLADSQASLNRMAELAGVSPVAVSTSVLPGARIPGDPEASRRQRAIWALAGFQAYRARLAAATADDANEAVDKTLAKLEAAHASLAKGGKPDLAAIIDMGERLKEALDRVKAARAGS